MHAYAIWQNILMLIGRILFGAIFIASGIEKAIHYNAATSQMINQGIPFAGIMVIVFLVIEIVAGFSVLVGLRTRWAAGLLLLIVIASMVVFHEYQAMRAMVVLAHAAVISAGLYIIAFGAGRYSLEGRKV
jgi:putative oxidoreductase